MTYEVQLQLGSASYTVRGPDTDGVMALIERLQTISKPEPLGHKDTFEVSMPATPLPEIEGRESPWVDWSGTTSPVRAHAKVRVKMVNGYESGIVPAHTVEWNSKSDSPRRVVVYRVVHP